MTVAARKAREAIAALSPQDRETHRIPVLQLELTAEMVELLGELVKQGRGDTPTDNTTDTAGTPSTGAGRSAAGDKAAGDDQGGGADVQIRTTEPEKPPADLVDNPPPARKPAPKKATKAAPGRVSTGGAP